MRELGGGTQNILLQLERGGTTYVLRRGPRHLRKHSNDAIRREMQVLQALAGTDGAPPAGSWPGAPTPTSSATPSST